MGVPQFAPWLIRKYPALVQSECPSDVHGLYIDLNGLIHPCCHDEENDAIAQRSEDEKLRQICFAIEELVVTTAPRHILFIAIDGVAPRAKMNQQRARRYMSAAVPCKPSEDDKDEFTAEQTREAQSELSAVEQDLLQDPLYGATSTTAAAAGEEEEEKNNAQNSNDNNNNNTTASAEEPYYWFMDDGPGCPYDPTAIDTATAREANRVLRKQLARKANEGEDEEGEERFDSNCISPGTTFMERVSAAVYHYVVRKLATHDAVWSALQVIFSDAHTPGEGEHKLVDFIRSQAARPGFCGRGAHVIAGLDADLIFLGLALHVPSVFLLRDQRRSATYAPEKNTATKAASSVSPSATPMDAVNGEEEDGDGLFMNEKDDNEDGDEAVEEEVVVDDVQVYIARNTSCEYFSIDIIAHSLVSEVYQLCVAKGLHMRTDPRLAPEGLIAANGYDFAAPSARKQQRKNHKRREGQTVTVTTTPPALVPFHPCTSSCNSKIIDDFVVMAMLMGNDFLPRVPSAICGEGAMDNLLEVYVSDVLPYGYLTAGRDTLSAAQLQRLFEGYARVEAAKFRQRAIAQQLLTARAAAQPLRSSADEAWRALYYRTTSITAETRREACRAYIEGVCFVWRYYCTVAGAALDWGWYYSFHHAPLALDLADYLQGELEARADASWRLAAQCPRDASCAAPDALTQLLCILPPTSAALVPAALRATMARPPAALQTSFPRRWLVDFTASFDKDYLATVLLPFADLPALRAVVHDTLQRGELDASDRARLRNVDYHTVLQLEQTSETSEEANAEDGSAGQQEEKDEESSAVEASQGESPREKRTTRTATKADVGYSIPADMLQPYPEDTNEEEGEATAAAAAAGFRALSSEELREGITRRALHIALSPSSSAPPPRNALTTPLRPRSYSHTVVIPNLSRGSDGKLIAVEEANWPRRRRGGRSTTTSNKTSARHAGRSRSRAAEQDESGSPSASQAASPLSPDAPPPQHEDEREDNLSTPKEAAWQDTSKTVHAADASDGADRFPWFGEVLVCVCALCVALVLWLSLSTRSTLKCTMASVLRVGAVCAIGCGLTIALGLAAPASVLTAHTIRRHHTRFTYVDWQCDRCLSLNFGSNLRCFICGAPYDARRCNALFSRKAPGGGGGGGGAKGAGLEYNHEPLLEHYCLPS